MRKGDRFKATALSVAVRGTTMPWTAGPRIGTGTILTTGGTTTGFAALLQAVFIFSISDAVCQMDRRTVNWTPQNLFPAPL